MKQVSEKDSGDAMSRKEVSGSDPVESGLTLSSMYALARRQLWVLLSVALVVTAGIVTYGLSQTRIYRATAMLQIDPRPPAPLGQGVEGVVELGARGYWATIEYYNTQHRLIASRPVALGAVLELGLHKDAAFLANLPVGKTAPKQPRKVRPEEAADILRSRLEVSPKKESRLVEVHLEDADRARGVRVLAAVLRSYLNHNLDRSLESTSMAVEWLGEQLETLKADLENSENALHQYKLKKQIASIGIDDQTGMLKREMANLTEVRTGVKAAIQEVKSRLNQIKKVNESDPELIPQTGIFQSEQLAELRGEYVESKRELGGLREGGKGEQHPLVRSASVRVETTRSSLLKELGNIKSGAQAELAALIEQEASLSSLLEAAEKKALDLNLMEIEYRRLKRTADNNEKLYGLVLERSKEAGLTEMLRFNNVKVLSDPSGSKSPVKPRLSLVFALGALVGLSLGFGAAVAREQLDLSIKTPGDLELRLGLLTLGSIPDQSGAKQSMLPVKPKRRRGRARHSSGSLELTVHQDPTGAFSEALKSVRTNLLFMSPDKAFRQLLVTSASPSEGKTTVACSLGVTMAQTGKKVLLVDCDMRRPRLAEVFRELPAGHSTLSQSLLNQEEFRPQSLLTGIPNLSVMPAGPTPPNPAELLQSQRFEELLDVLSAQYDMVLLDSPPLVVTDPAIISTRVDGAIFVVRSQQTDWRSAAAALRAIRDVGGRVVGGVLNAFDSTSSGYGGYQNYSTYGQVSNEERVEPNSGS